MMTSLGTRIPLQPSATALKTHHSSTSSFPTPLVTAPAIAIKSQQAQQLMACPLSFKFATLLMGCPDEFSAHFPIY